MRNLGNSRRVLVVGAGFSGLVSAFYLQRAGFEVQVIERRAAPGGLIGTLSLPEGLVETAANGLLKSKLVEELFSAVGVAILPARKESKSRFIFRQERARRWPLSFAETWPVVKFFLFYFFQKKRVIPRSGESIHEWGRRVLGRAACSYLLEPALLGIYAGDSTRLSARLILGRVFSLPDELEPKGQKFKARGTVSAPGGMGELITALHIYLEKKGVKFQFSSDFKIEAASSSPIVVATSAPQAAEILKTVDSKRAYLLEQVEMLPLITCTNFYREPLAGVRGFGCLFPPIENRRALGVLFNSSIFASRVAQGASETWILGGAKSAAHGLMKMSDQEILNLIRDERESCFASDDQKGSQVLNHHITRWPQALPHYTLELERRLPELVEMRQNLVLMGNYLGVIGLTKILERAHALPEYLAKQGVWAPLSNEPN